MAHLSTRWTGDIAIVTTRGYLMGGTETDELAEKIDELLAGGNRKLVIDLIETSHMNSTALGVMNRAHHRYREQGRADPVVSPHGSHRERPGDHAPVTDLRRPRDGARGHRSVPRAGDVVVRAAVQGPSSTSVLVCALEASDVTTMLS